MLRFAKENVNKSLTDKRSPSELSLRLDSTNLFDPMILAPHTEINKDICSAVEAYIERHCPPEGVVINIFIKKVNDLVKEKFVENFVEHYTDIIIKTRRYIIRRVMRMLILVLISLGIIAISFSGIAGEISSFGFVVVSNIGIFLLWEIGYTFFDNHEAVERLKKYTALANAKIEFIEKK